jgi:GTPase SAR1 family protein
MVVSYTSDAFPRNYKQTILDVYSAIVNVGNDSITLRLFDLSGLKKAQNYRKSLLNVCDVVVLCYSLIEPDSFKSVKNFWMNEIRESSHLPVVLVGTHLDLYFEIDSPLGVHCKAKQFAEKNGIAQCLECSALTQEGLKNVFDQAILMCLEKNVERKEDKEKCRVI